MSQEEILKYLKKIGKPVDIQQLLTVLPHNRATISKNCRRLRESKEIKFKIKKLKTREKFIYYL
jgi:hypothetical protein